MEKRHELTEREMRIAEAMRDLWEDIASDLLACQPKGEMRRSEVVAVMSDYWASHWPVHGSRERKDDVEYFLALPRTGKVRRAIHEVAFPSRYKFWGN